MTTSEQGAGADGHPLRGGGADDGGPGGPGGAPGRPRPATGAGAGVGGGGGAGAGRTADGRGAAGSRCPPAEGPGRSWVRRREEFATRILLCRTLTRGTAPANLTR